MKILSAQQIREADQYTIQHEPISSIDLMERAARACVNWLTEMYDTTHPVAILCGKGNNGGDGLAIARMLIQKKYNVKVFVLHYSEQCSEDFSTNLDRLKKIKNKDFKIYNIHSFEDFETHDFLENTVFIDAIFGSGLNRPIEGFVVNIIDWLNHINSTTIAIDVPSGLYCDSRNSPEDCIVKANYTLSFQFPKLSFMFPETANNVGTFSVLDIGINEEYILNVPSNHYFITQNDIRLFLKKRGKATHKGNFGHALIIAGSYGKTGAAVLSASSCLHTGTGLLTVHIPKTSYEILQTSIPEAMAEVDSNEYLISDNPKVEKYNAIGIGPGLGTAKETQNVVKVLIQNSPVPLVFDADAINILAENKTWLSFIPPGSIFTPHPKEFERLTEKASDTLERLDLQRKFSIKYNVYVVLKGAHTSISCPNGDIYFNSTGNPGMATAGSGDVLTGIITSLMAQNYTSQQACMMGVFLHGLAGDFAALKNSEESMIASDIIDHLGEAFQYLHGK